MFNCIIIYIGSIGGNICITASYLRLDESIPDPQFDYSIRPRNQWFSISHNIILVCSNSMEGWNWTEIRIPGNHNRVNFHVHIQRVSTLSGPFAGALLNEYFGFSAPFIALSSLIICGMVSSCLCIPNDKDLILYGDVTKSISLSKGLKSPKIMATFLALISVISASTYFSTFYINHMNSFGISQLTASLL